MRVEFINPFLEAADHVFEQMTGTALTRGRTSLKAPKIPYPDVCIVLGVVGQVSGQVIYGASKESAQRIAAKMMMGMPVDELNEIALSALAELGNMITGRASISLESAGFTAQISPPTVIIGNGLHMSSPKTQILVVPLSGAELGQFDIHVGLDETAS